MLEELKQEVCAANLRLVEYGLVVLTWGNVSAITPDRRYVVIKPSGVDYGSMRPEQMVVTDLDGRVLELTAAEYRLLCLLMANEGRTLPRGRILDVLWDGNGNFVDDNTLSVYIRRLREKTEKDPSRPRMLLTVRGIGYRWEAENASEKG